MTEITLDGDVVVVKWTGLKGYGSLLQIAAEGNAKNVNKLNLRQCVAVYICVKSRPFPCGDGKNVYRKALKFVDNQIKMMDAAEKLGLGKVRKSLVESAGGGFNAPTDSYISVAVEVVEEMTPA